MGTIPSCCRQGTTRTSTLTVAGTALTTMPRLIRVLVVVRVALRAVGIVQVEVVPMPDLVLHVLGPRPVSEVVEPVVGRIAVEMTCLHAVRQWPDERLHDEAVDHAVVTRPVEAEDDVRVPETVGRPRKNASPATLV